MNKIYLLIITLGFIVVCFYSIVPNDTIVKEDNIYYVNEEKEMEQVTRVVLLCNRVSEFGSFEWFNAFNLWETEYKEFNDKKLINQVLSFVMLPVTLSLELVDMSFDIINIIVFKDIIQTGASGGGGFRGGK